MNPLLVLFIFMVGLGWTGIRRRVRLTASSSNRHSSTLLNPSDYALGCLLLIPPASLIGGPHPTIGLALLVCGAIILIIDDYTVRRKKKSDNQPISPCEKGADLDHP